MPNARKNPNPKRPLAWRPYAALAASAAVSLVGLPEFARWNVHPEVQGLFASWYPMTFNTALGFFITGLALAALVLRREKIFVRAAGFLLAALGTATLAQYIFRADFGIDQFFRSGRVLPHTTFPGRMSANGAIGFFLLGIAFLCLGKRKTNSNHLFAAGIASSLPIAIGGVTIVGYWIHLNSTYGWGSYATMALPTAFGFVLSGCLLFTFVAAKLGAASEGALRVAPLYATLGLFLLTISIWQFFLRQDSIRISQIVALRTSAATEQVEQILRHHTRSLERLATRAEYLGTKDKDYLALDAKSYLSHLEGLTRIGLVGPNFKVLWSYPPELSGQVNGFDQSSQPRRKGAFEFALRERKSTLSQSIELKSGGTGFIVPVPLFVKEKHTGFIYATINAERFFGKILAGREFQIEVRDGDSVVYSNGVKGVDDERTWKKHDTIDLGNVSWNIELTPTIAFLRENESPLHIIVLGAGIFLSVLTGFFLQLSLRAKRQERKLRQNETRYRLLDQKSETERKELLARLDLALGAARMGIWSLDFATGAVWRSDNHDRIFGHAQQLAEWTQETFLSHIAAEDREQVLAALRAAPGQDGSLVECRIRLAQSGELAWIRVESSTFFGDDGKATHMIGIVRDITEQKLADEERWTSAELRHAILEGASHAIISADVNGNIRSFNRAAERMLGYRAEEVLGKSPAIFHDGEEVVRRAAEVSAELGMRIEPGFQVFIAVASVKRIADEKEWTYIRKDGSRFPIQLSVTAIRDASQKVIGYVGLAADITEKKAAVDELRSTTKKLRALLDSSPVGIVSLTPEMKVAMWNPACERIFGWAEEEVLGKALPFIPKEAAESAANIERVRRATEPVYVQAIRHRKDGTEIHIESAAMPLRNDAGEVEGMIAVLMDVTEKAELERALLSKNEELSKAVDVAIDEQDRATKASKVKSEFLANMSHEIRTPINGVLGMTGILLETKLSEEQREYAGDIKRSAEHLLSLVNDILDFSKVEAGKIELESIEFDLSHLVTDTTRSLEFSATSKNLALHVEGVKDWPNSFVGDPGRIRQVLINLLSNAIKFTPKGNIFVRVTDHALIGNERAFRFEVKDEGIGIPEAAMNRMFQAFSQADSATTRKFGGTGLGLSICKGLVELMGGRIGLVSEEGKGSTFWFEVPLRVGTSLSAGRYEKKDVSGATQKKFASARVLVAEDNIINQKVILKQLKALGITADLAATGLEVLAALEKNPYDLILMDCQMPEMDGYRATETIRGSARSPRIPIIALTADAISGNRERSLKSGMNDYVTKPIVVKELVAALDRWLPENPAIAGAKSAPVKSVDWSVLDDLAELDGGSDEGIVKELIGMFLKNAPEQVRSLHKFLDAGEQDRVRKEAHSLKSSSGNLGAMRFSGLCEELESLTEENFPERAKDLLKQIDGELAAVSAAFSGRLKKAA